jgi:hypothetical protein
MVDKPRLVFEALKAACTPGFKEEEMNEMVSELRRQIDVSQDYQKECVKRLRDATKLRSGMREEVAILAKKTAKLRHQYLKLHTDVVEGRQMKTSETIGNNSDYDFAIECLNLECSQLRNDIEYLRLALGIESDDDDFGENEQEEEVVRESEEEEGYAMQPDFTVHEEEEEMIGENEEEDFPVQLDLVQEEEEVISENEEEDFPVQFDLVHEEEEEGPPLHLGEESEESGNRKEYCTPTGSMSESDP